MSESAEMQVSTEDEEKSNTIQNEIPETRSCVPKIVMNNDIVPLSNDGSMNSKSNSSSTKNKQKDKKNRRKNQNTRASVLAEGQRSEVARSEIAAVSSESRLQESGWTKSSLAKATAALEKYTAMERADMGLTYTSDEWEAEDSAKSDTDDDHTDSSDDDDPKSQVDRLIERGAMMYMEGENSALSSEDESDTDDYEYDSESDITDVSPLVSAAASPLGLSPVLPRRTIPTSPLAIHDNRDLNVEYDDPNQCPFDWDNPSPSPPLENDQEDIEYPNEEDECHGSTNMNLLLQAVIELENQNNLDDFSFSRDFTGFIKPKKQSFIHPIRDNPHHIHLSKTFHRRKNMSFSNEEVRKIDRENKILLKKIMAAHTRKPMLTNPNLKLGFPKPTNSASTRKREERIRKENLLLLKKIQEAKPTKDLVPPIGDVDSRLSSVVVPKGNLRPPTSCCGAFLRSMQPNVTVPPPRKETAL